MPAVPSTCAPGTVPSETTFVLLHGLGGSHLNWIQVAPGLAGLGRVLAIDLPGFGTSPLAGRGAGLMDLREAVEQLLDADATGEIVLVGNSMGGVVAILEAAVEPERIGGLVLTGSAFPWARGAIPSPLVLGAFAATDVPGLGDAVVAARFRAIPPEQVVRIGFKLTMVDPTKVPPEVVELHEELVREQRDLPDVPRAFVAAARSLLRLGRRPEVTGAAMDADHLPRPRDPRAPRSVRPAEVRRGRARGASFLARTVLPRRRPRPADGGPRSVPQRGRGLVRIDVLVNAGARTGAC